jgi:MoxR-like ATPase
MAWQLNISPRAPKKSLPKNGNPGRLAKTIMRKSTLTLQPTVKDGIIIFEDSPLVRAVKEGHVLVVDEADKAPTHVTCILKTLVESGEMHLGDGRRIVVVSLCS